MDRHVIGLGGQLQAAEEIETVRILEENVLAIVAPHHHVLRDSGDETSSEPGHAETTSRSSGGGQDWGQIGQRQATLTQTRALTPTYDSDPQRPSPSYDSDPQLRL